MTDAHRTTEALSPCPHTVSLNCSLPWGHIGPCKPASPEPATNSVSVSSKSASPGEPSAKGKAYMAALRELEYQRQVAGPRSQERIRKIINDLVEAHAPEPRELQRRVDNVVKLWDERLAECHKWDQYEGRFFRGLQCEVDYLAGRNCIRQPDFPETKGAELRDCICSDPENCREPVPGRRCKAGLSVNGAPKHE